MGIATGSLGCSRGPIAGTALVLHPADLRIEALGPTREECIAEAARGLVDSFAVVAGRAPHAWAERHMIARSDSAARLLTCAGSTAHRT